MSLMDKKVKCDINDIAIGQPRQATLPVGQCVGVHRGHIGEPDQIAADEDGLSRGDRRT